MDSISISKSNTESRVLDVISRIQTYVIDGSKAAGQEVINAAGFSNGDFINALRAEVGQEVIMLNSVGELLISVANYVQSAVNAFSEVDDRYNTSKVE